MHIDGNQCVITDLPEELDKLNPLIKSRLSYSNLVETLEEGGLKGLFVVYSSRLPSDSGKDNNFPAAGGLLFIPTPSCKNVFLIKSLQFGQSELNDQVIETTLERIKEQLSNQVNLVANLDECNRKHLTVVLFCKDKLKPDEVSVLKYYELQRYLELKCKIFAVRTVAEIKQTEENAEIKQTEKE